MTLPPRWWGPFAVGFEEPADLPGWDESRHGPGARIEPCVGCPLCRVLGQPSGGGSPSPPAWARRFPEGEDYEAEENGQKLTLRRWVGGTPYFGPAPLCMSCWEFVRSLPSDEDGEE